jgi:hypothetical protein
VAGKCETISQIATSLSLVVLMLRYTAEVGHRGRTELYDRLEIIPASGHRVSDGARNEALQDLAQAGFSLTGLKLLPEAWLRGLDLRGANLSLLFWTAPRLIRLT